MGLNPKLLEVLQCPVCGGGLFQENESLICRSCKKLYPILNNIPDMRVYNSFTYYNEFNKVQACYEAGVHDIEATQSYEKRVINVYGTKTRLIVQDWAKTIEEMNNRPVVLDYGCGTGQISRILRHYVPFLFAFDISSVSVYSNVKDNGVIGVIGNGFFLPFKDGAFNLVCINGVLHHIVDLKRAIEEISRVTKKLVYISEPVLGGQANFRRSFYYPILSQKILYSLYILSYNAYSVMRRGCRFIDRIKRIPTRMLCKTVEELPDCREGSKYERPIGSEIIETYFLANGFKRKKLQYVTNIDIPGTSSIKQILTKQLINDFIGTHFDLRLDR